MATFLVQALLIVIICLVLWAWRNSSDLKLLRQEVRTLFPALDRLRERLKELEDKVHGLERSRESAQTPAIEPAPMIVPPVSAPAVTLHAFEKQFPVPVPAPTPASTQAPLDTAAMAVPVAQAVPVKPEPESALPPVPPGEMKPRTTPQPFREKQGFDWEDLIGVRLFSWIAGIAMMVAAIFFLRYSIDKGWLQPPVQMTIGIIVGLGLLILCEVKAAHRYRITANAMDASAVAILFATFFAAHALWHLIGPALAFILLVLVAAVAVLLSIRRDSLFIALLGLMGGFATPALLSSGENRPVTLFGYLLLLNASLAWVAARKQWHLLTTLSLLVTTIYQWGWVVRFLTADQLLLAMAIFLVFPLLTYATLAIDRGGDSKKSWSSLYGRSAELSATLPVLFALYLATVPGYGIHYGLLFGFLFLLAAGLFVISLARREGLLHLASAVSMPVVFLLWVSNTQASAAWPSFLAFLALFVLFYLSAPLVAARLRLEFPRPGERDRFDAQFLASVFLVLAGSALILMVWVSAAVVAPWPAAAILASGGLVLLSFLWIDFARRAGLRTTPYAWAAAMTVYLAQATVVVSAQQAGSPGVGSLIPAHLLFLGALACLAWSRSKHSLMVIAIAPSGMAVALWIVRHPGPEFWAGQLLFAGLVYLVFLLYPLALGRRAGSSLAPHLGAALASLPFFFQAWHTIIVSGWKGVVGILPVTQALLMTGLLCQALRLDSPGKRALGRLALIAGMALAFITAAIPLQLERQWITIAWALEGAALSWLYRKIPHRGLLYASSGLLTSVFVRLVFHAMQLSNEPRSAMAIWNWHLYTYCVAAAAMVVAGWLFSRTEDKIIGMMPRASSLFPAGGAILLFLLLNIEIADYFSLGDHITFHLSATLAQDLTYTLGWAVFAVILLGVGIAISSHAARVSALGLLVVTILKCFLHDLGRLGGLYRVGSFVGLALCLTLVALALQKFVLAPRKGAR